MAESSLLQIPPAVAVKPALQQPFRACNHARRVVLMLITAIFLCVGFLDYPLAFYLAPYGLLPGNIFFHWSSNLGSSEVWFAAGALLILSPWLVELSASWQRKAHSGGLSLVQFTGMGMLATLGAAGLTVNLMKYALGRPRPGLFVNNGAAQLIPFSSGLDLDSFPSGHSQTVWSAVLWLAFCFPRYRFLFFFLGLAASMSRVVLLKHYPSDVLGGFMVAWLWFLLFQRVFKAYWGRLKSLAASAAAPAAR